MLLLCTGDRQWYSGDMLQGSFAQEETVAQLSAYLAFDGNLGTAFRPYVTMNRRYEVVISIGRPFIIEVGLCSTRVCFYAKQRKRSNFKALQLIVFVIFCANL